MLPVATMEYSCCCLVSGVPEFDRISQMMRTNVQMAYGYGFPARNNLAAWMQATELGESGRTLNPLPRRVRAAKYGNIEQLLWLWYRNARASNIPLSGELLREKALDLAAQIGVKDFLCSDGWLTRFKLRHRISLATGELMADVCDALIYWSLSVCACFMLSALGVSLLNIYFICASMIARKSDNRNSLDMAIYLITVKLPAFS